MPKIFALLDRLTKAQNFLNEDQDVSKELFRVNNNFCSSSKYPIEDEFSFFDDLDPITTDSDQGKGNYILFHSSFKRPFGQDF